MNQISYTHPEDAKGPRYVISGGRSLLVQPGETVMEDVAEGATGETDGKKGKAKKAGTAENPLQVMLKDSIPKITELLPAMEEKELTELLSLEKAGGARVTLIGEIEARLLALKANS